MKAIVQNDPDNYGQDELWLLPSRNYTDPCFTAFFFFFPSCSECRFFFLILTQRDKNSKRESDRRGRGGEGRQGETETGSGESAIERRK